MFVALLTVSTVWAHQFVSIIRSTSPSPPYKAGLVPILPVWHTVWMKTIQQDLRSDNLFLNEAYWRGSESSTLETDVYVWHYALLVVYARNEEDNI